MPAPSVDQVAAYLSTSGVTAWSDDELADALAAEASAQARVCNVPTGNRTWPPHLTQALCRRVAANLARRRLPLGFQSGEAGAVRVAALDSEVNRLESGARRWVVA